MTGLTSLYIPASVVYLGAAPFAACPYLNSIVVDENNPVYSSPDNCNAIIGPMADLDEDAVVLIQGCNATTIPNNVNVIGPMAFAMSTELTNIAIPDSVHTIMSSAFAMCINLTSVTLSSNLMYIMDNAFNGCASLTSINLPESLISIDEYAFYECDNLTSIVIPASVTNLGEYAFYECDNLTKITVKGSNTELTSECGLPFIEDDNKKWYLNNVEINDYYTVAIERNSSPSQDNIYELK